MTPTQIIDALGGTGKVAELCEVTPGAVSQWKGVDKRIPKAQLRYLRVIRPEVFSAKTGSGDSVKEAA